MSDTYYREQAARRSRLILIGAIALLAVACLVFGTYSAFRDTCTRSFDREPRSIVESYVSAVARGDANTRPPAGSTSTIWTWKRMFGELHLPPAGHAARGAGHAAE